MVALAAQAKQNEHDCHDQHNHCGNDGHPRWDSWARCGPFESWGLGDGRRGWLKCGLSRGGERRCGLGLEEPQSRGAGAALAHDDDYK